MPKKTTATINVELEEDGLPSRATSQTVNPLGLRYLVIAPPGWGKTTTLTAYDDCILLACEEGHKFIECPKIIIDAWDDVEESYDDDGNIHLSFMEALQRLLDTKRFRFIVVDTLDALVHMCKDYFLDKYKGSHISDLGDYGKGYDIAQNSPIRQVMGALLKTGRGVGYITHQSINQTTFEKKGKKPKTQTKKETSLPNGIVKIVFPQMDVIFHGEFGETREGNRYRDRIIRTEGSEELLAKNRGGRFPRAFIVPEDPKESYRKIAGFLEDPSTVIEAEKEYHDLYGGFDDLESAVLQEEESEEKISES